MAVKKVYIDDIDGTEIKDGDGGGTVAFSIRGEFYEIDLSEKNQAKLDKLLEPYMSKGVKVPNPHGPTRGPVKATRTTKVPGAGRDYLEAVRRWGREQGYQISDRGRVKQEIIDAYEARG